MFSVEVGECSSWSIFLMHLALHKAFGKHNFFFLHNWINFSLFNPILFMSRIIFRNFRDFTQRSSKPKLFWVSAITPLILVILGGVFAFLVDGESHGIPIVKYSILVYRFICCFTEFILFIITQVMELKHTGRSLKERAQSNLYRGLAVWIRALRCCPQSGAHRWLLGAGGIYIAMLDL